MIKVLLLNITVLGKEMFYRRKVTLKNLAEKLGVTTATISKALRDRSDISEEMRKKVKDLAREMGYRPNIMARTLIQQRSFLIGVIIPDLRISFFSEVTRGIYEHARLKGYTAILMVNDENAENERGNLEFLSDLHVDGILLDHAPGDSNFDLYKQLDREGITIVCYDRKLEGFDFDSVTVDDRKAAFELTSDIVKKGRRKILFLGPCEGISLAKDRYNGYLDALKHFDIPFDPNLTVQSGLDEKDSYNSMMETLNKGIRPDAILCVGGMVAYGAGKAILESQYFIPDDIILAEFGDNYNVGRLGVPYITVNQNPYQMGKTSVDLLIDLIEDEEKSEKNKNILIDTNLIYREIGRNIKKE